MASILKSTRASSYSLSELQVQASPQIPSSSDPSRDPAYYRPSLRGWQRNQSPLQLESAETAPLRIGTVFQDFRLLPNKTVSENVAFALEVIGRSKADINELVPETLDMVGLDGKGHRYPEELSGGEQQRVAIARAFVNRPMLLIADEPHGKP